MGWKYKAVIFDFDMTLADSQRIIVRLLNETAKNFGYEVKQEDYVSKIIGNTHEKMLAYVTGEKDEKKILEMREYYRMLCRLYMPENTTFFPNVDKALERIYEDGSKLAVLSLKLTDLLEKSLTKYDLRKYFDVVNGCEAVSSQKPDPEGVNNILKVMNINSRNVLYVGDSVVDQETAYNAGVDFCAMLMGKTKKSSFDPQKVSVFCNSWKDFIDKYQNDEI